MRSSKGREISICAIICIRNEFAYLKVLIPYLFRQKIDVVIVDHGSTDQSIEYVQSKWNQPVIGLFKIPFKGSFSLSEQMRTKNKVQKMLYHDWILHHDADEIMHHYDGRTLREAIEEADREGYNVLNFDEFVFLPEPQQDFTGRNYLREATRYYYFQTDAFRLQRAFRREIHTNDPAYNGHKIFDERVRLFPQNHILRHYIGLSQKHLLNKYLSRTFDSEDLAKGWHKNRLDIHKNDLLLPGNHALIHELTGVSPIFNRQMPTNLHFWEWSDQ